jgi:predicted DNA-binding WGR domain protein
MKNMVEKTVYQLENWQQSKWRRDTRFYTLTLCQNIFGEWIITKTWGSAIKRGFGKSQDLNCPDYQAALDNYHKLQQRREKRGYKRVDTKSKCFSIPTQTTPTQPQHREIKRSPGQLSLF